MDKKVHYITEPEELLSWMKEHEDFKKMNSDDAQILLNYFEGHDYRLGTDKEGNLYRVDVNAEDGRLFHMIWMRLLISCVNGIMNLLSVQ